MQCSFHKMSFLILCVNFYKRGFLPSFPLLLKKPGILKQKAFDFDLHIMMCKNLPFSPSYQKCVKGNFWPRWRHREIHCTSLHNQKKDNDKFKNEKQPELPENQIVWKSDNQRVKEETFHPEWQEEWRWAAGVERTLGKAVAGEVVAGRAGGPTFACG